MSSLTRNVALTSSALYTHAVNNQADLADSLLEAMRQHKLFTQLMLKAAELMSHHSSKVDLGQ